MRKYLSIIILSAIYACTPMKKQEVDLLLVNGNIYQVDSLFSKAEAFAVKDGKFVAAGSNSDIIAAYSAVTIYDAGGKAVYPGFIDGHCHFYGFGENLYRYADLSGAQSFDEVITRLKTHASSHPSEWILGRGWDQNQWPGQQFPDNEQLESVFPGKKILLIRIDGHASLASRAALKAAGIDSKTRIDGGEIHLGADGEPTGILIDKADEGVKSLVPSLSVAEKKIALKEAQARCFAVGLTSVTDAGLPVATIELIREMQESNQLQMRVNAMIDPDENTLTYYLARGAEKTNLLSIRSVKLYADGALGSRGAKMKAPYSDAPGKTGLLMYDTGFYRNVMKRAHEAGFQVNTHAIGDAGVELVLKLYGEYLKGPNDKRWRIEHAQVVDPQDFELFGKYNIIPSIQSTHATSDMNWADERLGPERIKGAYAQKQLLETNGWLVNGTDFPIEHINPIYTFYAAVFRVDMNGQPEGGFQMENALTREEALRSISIWAAKGAFEEDLKGSIEPGKLADFVVTNRDLMSATRELILETKPLVVYSSGMKVFQNEF